MAEIDVLKAQIVRNSLDASWGFELEGGAEGAQPLAINKVAPESAASRIGLKPGDAITEIGDKPTESMTIQDAQEEINQYGLSLILTIERRSEPGSAPPETITVPVQVPVDTPLEAVPEPAPVPVASVAPQHPPAPVPISQPAPPTSVVHSAQFNNEPLKEAAQPAVTLVSGVQMTPQPQQVTVQPGPTPSAGHPGRTNIQGEELKGYQTYDMTGRARQQATKQPGHPGLHKMAANAAGLDLTMAEGRPFTPPADKPKPQMYDTYVPTPAQTPYAELGRSRHDPHLYEPVPYQDRGRASHSSDYVPDYYAPKLGLHEPGYNVQSPTFNKLSGVMANELVGTGHQGMNALPPVRSAVMEKKKAEELSKQREMVKVFMPQQYNSPMGLYSLPNVVETFAGQAEAQMSSMEQRGGGYGNPGQYQAQSAVQTHTVAPALLHQNPGNYSDM